MGARKASTILIAFVAVLVSQVAVQKASAAILVQWQATSASGSAVPNEYLARVTVGASNVEIGGFGVYGQAQVATTLKWVIFDVTQLSSPVFLSDPVTVPANAGAPFTTYAQWYDSPAMDFTLLANHAYAMGVLSNQYGTNTFYWGQNYYPLGGNPTVTGGGLTLPPGNYIVNSGVVGTTFTNTPTVFNIGADTRYHTSMRLSDVPEPATLSLLALGGLVVLRRRRTSDAASPARRS